MYPERANSASSQERSSSARDVPRPTLARAQVAMADAAFLNGDFERAESTYRKLLLEPQGESELRQLEVKLLALEAGDPARTLIRELLIGRPGHTTDPRAAMHLIDELGAYRRDGLALYLAARQLIGADSNVEKEYLVRVSGSLTSADLERLNHGLALDGVPLRPAHVSWLNADQLRFVLREGKKRQIRRMCEQVGLTVVGLKRVRIGRVMLGHLPLGQWRFLGADERF